MSESRHLSSLFREHKTFFVLVLVGLVLIELEIFALAALKSGRQSWLQVYNAQGALIYETDGQNLSKFNRYYFEKTFGPLENYEVRLTARERPFPFRAWFVAAVGLPVGLVMLFVFLVRVYQRLWGLEAPAGADPAQTANLTDPDETGFERFVRRFSRFNVFVLGGLILAAVLAYWIVPNLIIDMGRLGIETVVRFKWFFLGAAFLGFALVAWIVYLRYLLARKTIESRVEVDKYRLQLEYQSRPAHPRLISYTDAPAALTAAPPADPSRDE
jgi:hypothetical protein